MTRAPGSSRTAVGIDVGGTGIKGAVVDLDTGELASDRVRFDTPQPATPDAVRATIDAVVAELGGSFRPPASGRYPQAQRPDEDVRPLSPSKGSSPDSIPVGVALPAVVQHGVVRTAANIDEHWIETDLSELFADAPYDVRAFLNDADAAALAEVAHGAARDQDGLVITVTFGTGIGVGLIHDGRLIPNAELGHLELDGREAESHASARAREDEDLSWAEWGVRASRYLQHVENLLWPDLYLIGGGLAKNPDHWREHLLTRTPLRPAELINNAGIVGAAQASER